MRKWHRWLSVFFGIFLLWIAATGLLSQAADLWPSAPPSAQEPAASAPPADFVCPDGWRCTPPRAEAAGFAGLKGFFHHLHSGEEFGPVGVALSILSGLALVFFTLSGLWMYWTMWAERKKRSAKDRWFWK